MNMILQLSTPYTDPIPSSSPPFVGAIWRRHLNHIATKRTAEIYIAKVGTLHGYSLMFVLCTRSYVACPRSCSPRVQVWTVWWPQVWWDEISGVTAFRSL